MTNQLQGKMNIALSGHSFVVSLYQHIQNQHKQAKSVQEFPRYASHHLQVAGMAKHIFFHGQSGAKITENFHLPVSLLSQHNPDILILDIGTNDVTNPNLDVQVIADQIMAHAEAACELFKVRLVVITSVIMREKGLQGYTKEQFLAKAEALNSILLNMTASTTNILFHKHPGFSTSHDGSPLPMSHISRDGIHPNTFDGRRKYVRSITSAIHKAVKRVNLMQQ